MSKIFGLFCPYHKDDILEHSDPEYDKLCDYPREFRRVRKYTDKYSQLEAYANVMCPASQMFECEEEELEVTLNDLNVKFDDEDWLKENVYPYL